MKAAIGDLGETLISVKAYGTFTEANDQISNYQNSFAPAEGFLPITVRENALYTGNFNNLSNDNLVFAENTTDASCPMCGKTVTWTPITGETTSVKLAKDGHYYLPADVTVNAADNGKDAYLYSSLSGGTACLHLNGHNLTVTGHRAIISGMGVLNIMGNGVVSGERNVASGATIHVNTSNAGATVNLLGGTYTKSAADQLSSILYIGGNGGTINMYKDVVVDATDRTTAEGGTAVLLVGGEGEPALFTMYGGQIKNGHANERGGNISVSTGFATFRMKDGMVSGGQAGTNGGNIYGATGATIEILGGTVKNGKADKYGGNVFTSGSNLLRVENAVVSGGEATSHGGNIFAENDLQILSSIVSGGKAGGSGGNIYAGRRDTTRLAELTITNSVIGITTLENTEAFQKGGIANAGGNISSNYVDVTVTGSRLLGGEVTSHGGNGIINNGKLTLTDTEVNGGTTTSQGGALRIYKSTLVMNSGSISGGSAKKYTEYSNANVSLSTESVFYFLGGTITASAEADRRGTGIDVGGGCKLYLGGNATVVDSSSLAGVNVRETSVVRVCNGWSGSANIWLGKTYASGAELETALLQTVTLDKNLNETAGGAFTGTLTQQGGLGLTADATGKFTVA